MPDRAGPSADPRRRLEPPQRLDERRLRPLRPQRLGRPRHVGADPLRRSQRPTPRVQRRLLLRFGRQRVQFGQRVTEILRVPRRHPPAPPARPPAPPVPLPAPPRPAARAAAASPAPAKASSRSRCPRGSSRPRSSCCPCSSTRQSASARSVSAVTRRSLTQAWRRLSAITVRRRRSTSSSGRPPSRRIARAA